MGGAIAVSCAYAGGNVAWIVPIYRNGRTLWRWAEKVTGEARAAGLVQSSKTDRIMEFPSGGMLGVYSADNEDGIRGESFNLVILDEAARMSPTAWTDAIQPTLADADGEAILISTPKGLNWFYSEWYRGLQDGQIQAAWLRPSADNPNPKIKQASMLAQARVPDRTFRQEWLAEFIEDGAYFQNVNACAVIEQPDQPEQHAGHYLVMGGDLAISEDYTVLAVACRNCNRVVDWRRFNQIAFGYQREQIVELATRWNAGALIERNSIGVPNLELLRGRIRLLSGPDHELGYNTTATTKPPLINGLATAFEHHGFLVPKEAAEELRAFQVETLTSGHPKFSAPEGLHDDWVISLSLAWYAISNVQWLIT